MKPFFRCGLSALLLSVLTHPAIAALTVGHAHTPTEDLVVGSLTYTQSYAFANFAGAGGMGALVNGAGTAAKFNGPNGLAVDQAGNVYVAESSNWVIRKITPSGVVSTFAGIGPFQSLSDVKLDAAGNVYTSDGVQNVIFKVTPSGSISVFVGTVGVTGSADGTGAAAQFNSPGGMAFDANGNLYVSDAGNNTIRKITPAGVVSTIAGTAGVSGSADGTGPAAQFFEPAGLAFDSVGNLYVADYGNKTVRVITPNSVVSTFAGTARVEAICQDGTGASASFAGPAYLAFDANGNLLVTDAGAELIRRITPAGVVTTCAGSPGTPGGTAGTGANATFSDPFGIVIDGSGTIYVADSAGNTIQKGLYTPPPAALTVSIATQLPSTPVINGSAPITLTAVTTGNPTSYQWTLNGVAIAGATSYQWVVSPTAANQGDYSVTASNATSGAVSADAGTLTVTTDAWIINLSARAYSQSGDGGANQLIAGFVTTGPGMKSILVRGDGPALGGFDITDFLSDPLLTLVSGSTTVASTASWSTSLDATFAQVGAFSFTAGSHDTALLESLVAGPYTAQVVSQTTNNGVALAEIYDADEQAPTDRLVNISARAFVGTGVNILIGGFVISGNTSQTVIIRGDGPALAGFGLSGALANATLTLSSGTGTIATNSGWGDAPAIGSAATSGITVQPLTSALSAKVGAFALTVGSNDAAIVATLPPGNYTAQVSGANGSTGVALVEIYELR